MAVPEVPESLQCLACAIRQETGSVNETVLENYMLGLATSTQGQAPDSSIRNAYNIRLNKVAGAWSVWPNKRRDLDSYLTSCVLIANELYDWLPNRKYRFYHSNAFEAYKDSYIDLAKRIHQNTTNNNLKRVYAEVSKSGADDKWNPADIVAVDQQKENRLVYALENFDQVYLKIVAKDPRGSKLRKQNEAFRKKLDKKVTKRLHVMEGMEEVYEYNHYIDRLFKKRDLVGVSLKKQASPTNVPVKVFDHKDVKGIKESLELDLVIKDVQMEAKNKKAIVKFDLNGVTDAWKMDVRGGSSKIDTVQMQLQHGSQASHGKASISIFTLITNLTGGEKSIREIKKARTRIFGNIQRNRELGINYAINIPSGGKSFPVNTDVFREYQSRRTGKFSTGTWRLHLDMWAEYIAFLSSGDSTKDDVLHHYNLKNGTGGSNNLNGIRYIKDKVQSGEVGYVLDKDAGVIEDAIKDNIMRGVYTYAGSRGFRIFRDKSVTDFMTSSTYLKIGGA